jgi:hypothetical protein
MEWSRRKEVQKGDTGERIVRSYLESKGWVVYEPITEGRHAFDKRLQQLGFELTKEQVASAFARFKDLCDKKKEIFDDDLVALVEQEILAVVPEIWALEYLATTSGTRSIPTATVVLRSGDDTARTPRRGTARWTPPITRWIASPGSTAPWSPTRSAP